MQCNTYSTNIFFGEGFPVQYSTTLLQHSTVPSLLLPFCCKDKATVQYSRILCMSCSSAVSLAETAKRGRSIRRLHRTPFAAAQAMPPKEHPLPPPPAMPQVDKEALRQEILGQSVDNLEEWLTVDPGAIAVLDGSSKDHSRKNRKAQKQPVHTSKKAKDPDEAVPGLSVATSSGSVPAILYTGQRLPQRGMASTASALEVKAAMEVDSESVDYAGDSDAEPVAKQPKYQLDCMNAGGENGCGQFGLMWTDFLLVKSTPGTADASWAGKIWGHCRICSGMNEKEFDKQSRHRKEARAKILRGHRKRAKTMTFKTMRSAIKDKLPGATHAQLRALTELRMKAMAAALCLAYEKANEHAKLAYQKVLDSWRDEVERCAKDPAYAASTDARTMSAEEASYFSHVMKGMHWSYLCRKKQCMFFGGNNVETWIKENKGYRCRCPMCGYLHQPWKTTPDDVPAARVLTVTHPLTGELMHIPTINPAAEDEGWLNQMIEVTARNMQTEDDVQKLWDRTVGDVNQWLAREGVCRAWTKLPYRPEQHRAFVDTNAYDATRQEQNGYVMGLKLTDLDAARQPYTDFNGLISVFANFVAASKALVSKM